MNHLGIVSSHSFQWDGEFEAFVAFIGPMPEFEYTQYYFRKTIRKTRDFNKRPIMKVLEFRPALLNSELRIETAPGVLTWVHIDDWIMREEEDPPTFTVLTDAEFKKKCGNIYTLKNTGTVGSYSLSGEAVGSVQTYERITGKKWGSSN